MSHNSYTHTDNTCQPELRLKSSLCSSAISNHNSRDAILRHHSRNATCLTAIPSHNSRDTFRATTQGTSYKLTFKVSPQHCRSRTSKENKASAIMLLLGIDPKPPGKTRFQNAWWGTRVARR